MSIQHLLRDCCFGLHPMKDPQYTRPGSHRRFRRIRILLRSSEALWSQSRQDRRVLASMVEGVHEARESVHSVTQEVGAIMKLV
jgi:hypothetical protein